MKHSAHRLITSCVQRTASTRNSTVGATQLEGHRYSRRRARTGFHEASTLHIHRGHAFHAPAGPLAHSRIEEPISAFGADRDAQTPLPAPLCLQHLPASPLHHLSHHRHLYTTDYATFETIAGSFVRRTCYSGRAVALSRPSFLPHVDYASENRATSTVQLHPSSSLVPLAPTDGYALPSSVYACGVRSWTAFGRAARLEVLALSRRDRESELSGPMLDATLNLSGF